MKTGTQLSDELEPDDIERARRTSSAGRKLIWMFLLSAMLILLVLRDVYREISGEGLSFAIHIPTFVTPYIPAIVLVFVLLAVVVGPMLGLGRSPHRLVRPSEIDVDSDDMLGASSTVEMIEQLLEEYRNFQVLSDRYGATPPRAVLFEGPPGTGKTMAAKVIAKRAGVPFLFVSGSSFQAMYYGQSGRKVRSYFRELRRLTRRYGGAIGFIEEFDAIGSARTNMGVSQGADGVTGVVAELLVQLQSFEHNTIVERIAVKFGILSASRKSPRFLLVAATNRASELDPALIRPGRFDRSIHFDLPNVQSRREIVYGLVEKRVGQATAASFQPTIDRVASMSGGLSQASLYRMVEEAGVIAFHDGKRPLLEQDLWNAFAQVALGRNSGVPYNDFEKLVVSVHEGGHCCYRWFGGGKPNVSLVSILKRGEALGLTASHGEQDTYLLSRDDMLDEIAALMAGMVAEEMIFGDVTSGSSSDLKRATSLAMKYSTNLAMGRSLISLGEISPQTEAAILTSEGPVRDEIESILRAGRERSFEVLSRCSKELWRLAMKLCEVEELDVRDLTEVLGPRPNSARSIDVSQFESSRRSQS
ncbi:Peptidase family M41 [Ferrithrix thermotolerans DSM 19514]|uniref:Peptidase family M41 n=1 Tax=Ferrithrix thermotolerans DSM 19514 TaxID=1121881 RepID=A0A1M4VTU6_9ACTN|nr:AAA family ATPase [Ferrithrix thermotolerans]SHE72446.1 Peptidase family M41 [Ferrithrix thermotolerans DSM 19514]